MDWLIGPPVKAKSGRFAGVPGKKRSYLLGSDERKRHDPNSEEIQAMERSG
jgi:hypothetical protein